MYIFRLAMTNHHKIKACPLVVEPSKNHLKISQRFSVWDISPQHHPDPSLHCQNQPQLKHWQSQPTSIGHIDFMNHHVQNTQANDNYNCTKCNKKMWLI